jgi:hydrogenase nickel incorporation protein HypA/HybF
MHEWALAEAVVSAVYDVAEKEGLKTVSAINLKVGELQQIDLGIFKFALSQLFSGKLKDTRVNITKTHARLKCRACGHKWLFSKNGLDESAKEAIHFVPEIAHAYVRCPLCGSPDFDVERGRGVWIQSVKGEKKT